jgi:hypothetical protein
MGEGVVNLDLVDLGGFPKPPRSGETGSWFVRDLHENAPALRERQRRTPLL